MWPYRTRSDLCQMQGVRGRQPALHPRMGVHRPGVSQELVRAVLVMGMQTSIATMENSVEIP